MRKLIFIAMLFASALPAQRFWWSSTPATSESPSGSGLAISAIVGDWTPRGCTNGTLISTMPDYAGTPHNLTAAGSARPTCVGNVANGHAVARFNGTSNILATASFSVANPTIFIVAKGVVPTGTNALFDSSPLTAWVGFFDTTHIQAWAGGAGAPRAWSGSRFPGDLIVAHFEVGSLATTFDLDRYGIVRDTSGSFPGTLNGVTIGGSGGAYFTVADIAHVIVCDGTMSPADKKTIEDYLITKYGLASGQGLVFDGDSITFGTGLSDPEKWTNLFTSANPAFAVPALTKNIADAGQNLAGIQTNWDTNPPRLGLPGGEVYFFWAGTNDISYLETAIQIEDYITSITAAAHAAGYRVGFASIMSRGDFDSTKEAKRITVNQWIRDNASMFEGFVDIGADATMGCPSCNANTTYFQDGIHPTAAGAAYIAALFGPVILAIP